MIPTGRIDPQPWMSTPAVHAVITALAAEGAPARFVGGCVRDSILGRLAKDIDIATPRHPDDVIARLAAAGIAWVPTGLAHGTVTAVFDGARLEVTTLRRDVRTDGRRAVVAFTDDWTADAARRDFTINALYCDPDGTLYDPMDGLADLRAGRVRFVGQARPRIAEDALRMLRFFRFHAWYGRGTPDPDAMAACREMAPMLARLSGERVGGEVSMILLAPDAAATLAFMDEVGTVAFAFGGVMRPERLARAAAFEDRLGLTPSAVRRLAATLDRPPDAAARLCARLRLSRSESDRLAAAIAHAAALVPGAAACATPRALYRWGAAGFADALAVAVAADPGARLRQDPREAALADWTRPILPLSGADVLTAGVPEGPRVGALLRAVEDWWIEKGFAPDRDACLARLGHLIAD